MPEDIINNQGAVFDFAPASNDEKISLKSTILPAFHSFIEPSQESLIPKDNQLLLTTQAHFVLLHELKEFLQQ